MHSQGILNTPYTINGVFPSSNVDHHSVLRKRNLINLLIRLSNLSPSDYMLATSGNCHSGVSAANELTTKTDISLLYFRCHSALRIFHRFPDCFGSSAKLSDNSLLYPSRWGRAYPINLSNLVLVYIYISHHSTNLRTTYIDRSNRHFPSSFPKSRFC